MAQMKIERNKGGRPRKYKTAEEVETLIQEYFDKCDTTGRPYTMSGLALALDLDRKTLVNYGNSDEFFPTIKKAREVVQAYAEERLYQGGNTAGIIFALKNNYNWTDTQTINANVDETITINVDEK